MGRRAFDFVCVGLQKNLTRQPTHLRQAPVNKRIAIAPWYLATGLGKTKRKTSALDPSPTPSMEAEYPWRWWRSAGGGGGGGAERIYVLNIHFTGKVLLHS
ncbi:hypothetical protein E1301_Tti012901 [Triplophysa tibetana]|uniref:Uncharacterized protein n=1 Tax=Triplophysa tibetana TaxID=1572043 RepID=A0A5A9P2Z7_9TELE|nr:hypothetical protein E1301_Tti012901 [Triplophysa tibetana]